MNILFIHQNFPGQFKFLAPALVVEQLPFMLKVPNLETHAAMTEAEEIARTRRTRFATATELFDDLEKNSGK
jgi:DNA-damage-inducible protein J